MTPAIYEQLVDVLKGGPQPLEKIQALAAEAGSNWTREQLHLFLAVINGVELEPRADGKMLVRLGRRTPEEELADAVIEVVRSQGGKPMPAALVVRLLDGRFTTSVEQVKKVWRGKHRG